MRVAGLSEVTAAGVQNALGLTRGARGVEDEQRVLGIERVSLMRRGLARNDVVPPDITTALPLHVLSGALDYQHLADRVRGERADLKKWRAWAAWGRQGTESGRLSD